MDEFNPYAPPAAGTEEPDARPRRKKGKKKKDDSDGSGCWQQDGLAVLEKHSGQLPDRCVICNRKTRFRLQRTFTWHNPSVYFLMLAGWIVYFIVAAMVRKTAVVSLGLCKEHRARRTKGLTVLWAGVGVSALVMIMSMWAEARGVAALAVVSLGVFAIVGGRMTRVASASKVSDTLVWIKAGAPFVDSLPESPDDD